MSGWIAVKRDMIEHPALAPTGEFTRLEAWLWMLSEANFRDREIDLGGGIYSVPRGSFCHSLRFIAGKFGWTVKRLRTFLKLLERHGMVKIDLAQVGSKRGTARTHLTICNYDKYQNSGHSRGTAGAQQGHKEEQGNNVNTPLTPLKGGRVFGVPDEVKRKLGVIQ